MDCKMSSSTLMIRLTEMMSLTDVANKLHSAICFPSLDKEPDFAARCGPVLMAAK